MTQNKKHVIPKVKYGRKRREYFHNEEREQRVQQERQARKQREEKAEILAKNNEERVKENLRKARIEKLTQEEIQQQQAIAAARNSKHTPERTENDESTSADNIHHPYNENENIADEKNNINSKSSHVENVAQNDSAQSNEQHVPAEKQQEENFYSENAQQSRVDDYLSNDEQASFQMKHQKSASEHSNRNNETKHESTANTSDKVKAFFIEHWAKILIVVAVIVLLTLIQAIFKNVDENGTSNDSVFNDNQNKDKTYTTTMKSANSAIHSVVTVENDTSDDRTSAEKETQEAGKENELGSGVVYKKVGDSIFIMTNAHVVGDKKEQKITYGNDDYAIGKVVGTDKYSDIAVVKAKVKSDSKVKPIKIGDSSTLVLGEPIIVVGNPLGVDFKGSISDGIISGLNRHIPVDINKDDQYDVLMSAFQIDAPVNPGNSGGAVIDRNSKLVGIASLKIDMDNVEGIAFAIPVNDAEDIAKQLEDKGEVKYPNTGVKIANISEVDEATKQSINLPEDVKKGVLVGDVKKDSLGEKSGLQKNDVIVELDGKALEDNLRYRQIIFNHKDDLKTLSAKIYRDGKEKDIKIKLK
ncbi:MULTISPECIES: S1C family serine protease [Staphylococcus]|uniref:Serine protease HtrA-like n=1 Tax=Staphylococcus ureilyticus TaxID=94138 RepID=A0AB34AFR9_STAUR|nr:MULTISPECIES: S1C family serine protease [Staphylococcus]MBL0375597.1 trypsin-like peptidase domain-containing protein [Staphylococcus sp. S75]MBL0384114.1 trypsin-like peptidase domain-containing protein [Staphylococcus sp. S59]MBL0401476.1 trypsin-like peptidase domain-containing protein [Staphylococcus sp. S36]QKU17540.1 trypsin-like peptidase domain-containing protein [Staphylococcus cohnii]MCT1913883.1 trypsin-like peptidase domain-containing protein [Staphylococcus ureilyticus]